MTTNAEDSRPKKRKRTKEDGGEAPAQGSSLETTRVSKSDVLLLETQILESRKHYNNIATLIGILGNKAAKRSEVLTAAVALCRVFCRLVALNRFKLTKSDAESEVIVVQWLKDRCCDFIDILLNLLNDDDAKKQTTALTLLMRLVKEDVICIPIGEGPALRPHLFENIIMEIIRVEHGDDAREAFVAEYLDKYDDLRFLASTHIADLTSHHFTADQAATVSSHVLYILSNINTIPTSKDDLKNSYFDTPMKKKGQPLTLTSHKVRVQRAWLGLLSMGLNTAQRNSILGILAYKIAPWFAKAEMLMDFLTDSFNMGGSTSLLALSGLFHLMQQKNLDYPLFYPKLYSLLDCNILHSRHRSRFFRLLDTFLGSTHLPAALVASFIKRLARLSLRAPPAGIVVVVPWIYNLLKKHPLCTFMIHREADPKTRSGRGNDPFDEDEQDPMQTGALESSLWEIEMLQSHYHPNVATLAKIISEQFTKQRYNIEDFLDHSYASMLDMELSKTVKKPPVVEFEIPKKIFSNGDGSALEDVDILRQLWTFTDPAS
ncbi:MAG: hypothetical protein M1825_002333 [Sarcosagium campestre]|nr:MAG: hypothetical protein M1825_002333 [Sarcosagium campestre]